MCICDAGFVGADCSTPPTPPPSGGSGPGGAVGGTIGGLAFLGALAFFLSETLAPRQARHALGVQVAVDWATQWERGMHKREVFQGSGGRRLVQGKFGEIVACVRHCTFFHMSLSVSSWS